MTVSVTLKRDQLNAALRKVAHVVANKNTIPILGNMLLELEAGAISITATDLDIHLRSNVPAEHKSAGERITVPAGVLTKLVSEFPPTAEIVMSWADDRRVDIKCGRSRYKLNALPASDFPDWPTDDQGASFDLPPAVLAGSLAVVAGSMSDEPSRFYLNGIYMHRRGQDLVFVATNGHKLARHVLKKPAEMPEFAGVIIPSRTVNELVRLIDAKSESNIQISVSTKWIAVTTDGVSIRSKLIEGTFPDYGRVIPENNDKVAVVDVDDLKAAIGRVRTIVPGKNALKFSFTPEGLTISGKNADSGEGEEHISIEEGDTPCELEIGFNGQYVLDALAALDTGVVRFKLADPASPGLIDATAKPESTIVVMPMRV